MRLKDFLSAVLFLLNKPLEPRVDFLNNKMIVLMSGSACYLGAFLILPCLVRKGPNQGIIRSSILLAVFCLWIFWAIVYISQMNPLVGPRHANTTLIWMNRNKPQPHAADKSATRDERKKLRSRPRHCSNEPDTIFECCNIPWLPRGAIAKCMPESVNPLKLTCEQARCAFEQAEWLVAPGTVKTASVADYYERVATRNHEWELAVDRIKTECLESRMKFQGIYISCPEYDIAYCAMIRMMKNGPLAAWSTATTCVAAKQFASNCPICPENCNLRDDFDGPSLELCHACLTF